jgi:ABC-type nitrate/sulfonate/bicarbonate transport system substrate-binding protein
MALVLLGRLSRRAMLWHSVPPTALASKSQGDRLNPKSAYKSKRSGLPSKAFRFLAMAWWRAEAGIVRRPALPEGEAIMSIRAVAALALAVVSLCSAGVDAAETVKIRYGAIANSARSISSLPLYTAQRQGFLAREGIELQVVPLPGVEHMVNAVESGDVDITHTATPYLIQAVLSRNFNTVAVIGGPANTVYSLMARPEIKSFADLKGRVVGLSLPADTISISTRLLLAKHGLNGADYKTQQLVGTPVRAKCVTEGDCAAVPLGQPEDILFARKGYTKLGDSSEVIPELQFNVLAARKDWAAAHKDTVVRLARAFADTYRYMADAKNRDAVAAIMAETTNAPVDVAREILTFYYEPYRGVMPRAAEISMAGMAKVIELLGEAGEIARPLPPAERFVDLTYLKAAGAM